MHLQLWRDEEALRGLLLGALFADALEDSTLIIGIHALVDLVDDAEGDHGMLLQAEHEDHDGQGLLASRLKVAQVHELRAFAELDHDVQSVLFKVVVPVDDFLVQFHLPNVAQFGKAVAEVGVDRLDQLAQARLFAIAI